MRQKPIPASHSAGAPSKPLQVALYAFAVAFVRTLLHALTATAGLYTSASLSILVMHFVVAFAIGALAYSLSTIGSQSLASNRKRSLIGIAVVALVIVLIPAISNSARIRWYLLDGLWLFTSGAVAYAVFPKLFEKK